jgi:hypothetical protein
MRPSTAAARVNSRSELPPPDTLVNDVKPTIGTRMRTASADRVAAMLHTIVERVATGMPRRPARSPLSAAARIPMP